METEGTSGSRSHETQDELERPKLNLQDELIELERKYRLRPGSLGDIDPAVGKMFVRMAAEIELLKLAVHGPAALAKGGTDAG